MGNVQRGARVKLSEKLDCSRPIDIVLKAEGPCTYDFVCFGVDGQNKLSDDRYMVFYNQTSSPQSEICMSSGSGYSNFTVDLSRIPQNIQKLVFTASIDGNGSMNSLQRHNVSIMQNSQAVLDADFSGADFLVEKAIISLEIYNKGGIWRASFLAQGFSGGLSDLLKYYGGEEDITPAPAAKPVSPAPAPVQPAPSPAPVSRQAAPAPVAMPASPAPAPAAPVQTQAAAPAGAVRCPDCGTISPAASKFCQGCGKRFEVQPAGAAVCPSCGTANPVQAKFCKNCGGTISAAQVQQAVAAPDQAKCPSCGRVNIPGASFCEDCGASLGAARPVQQAAPAAPAQGNAAFTPFTSQMQSARAVRID